MNNRSIDFMKRFLIVMALLSVFGLVYAQPRPAVGDYRATDDWVDFTSTYGWLVRTSTGWVNATQPIAGQVPPFTGNIFSSFTVYIDADYELVGSYVNTSSGSVVIDSGATLTIGTSGKFYLTDLA